MKFSIAVASIILFSAWTWAETWREYKSFDGKFRVVVPKGEMTQKSNAVKTAIGELTYHSFFHKSEGTQPDCVFYLVSYCDYPKGSFPTDSTDLINEFFNSTIEESATSVRGTVIYQNDIHYLTHKGKIWRVQYNNDKAIIKSKCYLVGDRFYMIQAMMTKEKSLNPSADKFLESFQAF
jgi:REP element-mobilizing transposase RayT